MSLEELSQVLKAPLVGTDEVFTGISTDTRKIRSGDLFVAIKGPNYDGHDFLAEAKRHGAAGAIAMRATEAPLPCVQVEDTRRALGQLAAYWRSRFNIPVIAVTGSNGKTTVKEMIAAIMARTGRGCVTEGNLNNDIGAPLTLSRLRPHDRFAVVELGTNRRGEMRYLATITRPTIAVVTNAAEAHLEGVGTVEQVAREKGELFTALGPKGVAIINADDDFAALWRSLASPRRCITFGLLGDADFTADYHADKVGSVIRIKSANVDFELRLPLLGQHNVSNALAATAAVAVAGARPEHIKDGLEKLRGVSGRLQLKAGRNGARVIDDTYNANPGSMAAAIAVLKDFPGESTLVIGDMAELGEAAPNIHRRVGKLAKDAGITYLFTIGKLSKLATESFGEGARHFSTHDALTKALTERMRADMTILVKGSRIMQLERVIREIAKPRDGEAGRATAAKI
ncbi:MAG: UDP-N-acetylmuramoyl-tripeptide--D-alanyl-D-alanine ligase [Acidiferrobacterales bacterium]